MTLSRADSKLFTLMWPPLNQFFNNYIEKVKAKQNIFSPVESTGTKCIFNCTYIFNSDLKSECPYASPAYGSTQVTLISISKYGWLIFRLIWGNQCLLQNPSQLFLGISGMHLRAMRKKSALVLCVFFLFFFFLQSCSAAGHANGWCWSLTFFQWQYLSSHDRHAHPWGTKAVQMPGTESGAVLKLYMLDMLCTKAATTIGGNNNKASKEEVCYSQRSQRRESVHASQGHR